MSSIGSSKHLLAFGVIMVLSHAFSLDWRFGKRANTSRGARALEYVGISFPF